MSCRKQRDCGLAQDELNTKGQQPNCLPEGLVRHGQAELAALSRALGLRDGCTTATAREQLGGRWDLHPSALSRRRGLAAVAPPAPVSLR